MAFSLEAALVIPISIGFLACTVSMALPAYQQVRQTAGLAADIADRSYENGIIYKIHAISKNGQTGVALETSVSRLIDLIRLADDLSRPIRNLDAYYDAKIN